MPARLNRIFVASAAALGVVVTLGCRPTPTRAPRDPSAPVAVELIPAEPVSIAEPEPAAPAVAEGPRIVALIRFVRILNPMIFRCGDPVAGEFEAEVIEQRDGFPPLPPRIVVAADCPYFYDYAPFEAVLTRDPADRPRYGFIGTPTPGAYYLRLRP